MGLDCLEAAAGRLSNESLADQVYKLLESSIIEMKLAPGSILSEDELAEKLDVSRSPVREALFRLEYAGLVNKERKSRVVTAITEDMIIENYHFWAMTESYAAGIACRHAGPQDLARIRRLLEKLEESRNDTENYQQLNCEFHSMLAVPCPYKKLVELHENALSRIRWGYNFTLHLRADIGHSNANHHEIFEAYCVKDGGALESMLREHIENAARRLMKQYFDHS